MNEELESQSTCGQIASRSLVKVAVGMVAVGMVAVSTVIGLSACSGRTEPLPSVPADEVSGSLTY